MFESALPKAPLFRVIRMGLATHKHKQMEQMSHTIEP